MPGAASMKIAQVELDGGRTALRFAGRLALDDVPAVRERSRALASARPRAIDLDLSGVEEIDGGVLAVLLDLRRTLAPSGIEVRLVGAAGGVARLVELYDAADRKPQPVPPPAPSALDEIGRAVLGLVGDLSDYLDYLGSLLEAFVKALRRPANINWRDVAVVLERAGADGFPIVVLITFLVGMVTAFQAIVQLRQFGADIFVADLVALSVTRELGPLMTAIIVAGRSGAAFSAEIGTMAVSEEVDALKTLGLSPYGFLVYPRIIRGSRHS
jgi:phospholipid/cholesterol/gamma-HCH transport system permease protein